MVKQMMGWDDGSDGVLGGGDGSECWGIVMVVGGW